MSDGEDDRCRAAADRAQVVCKAKDRPVVLHCTEVGVLSVRQYTVVDELSTDDDILARLVCRTNGLQDEIKNQTSQISLATYIQHGIIRRSFCSHDEHIYTPDNLTNALTLDVVVDFPKQRLALQLDLVHNRSAANSRAPIGCEAVVSRNPFRTDITVHLHVVRLPVV